MIDLFLFHIISIIYVYRHVLNVKEYTYSRCFASVFVCECVGVWLCVRVSMCVLVGVRLRVTCVDVCVCMYVMCSYIVLYVYVCVRGYF